MRPWPELISKPLASLMLISLAVVALALLGAYARMFHDHPDPQQIITRRDIVRYGSAGLLAGIVLCLVVYWYQGKVDPLLFAIAGLGGFGAVQFLGLGVDLVKSVIRKLGYDAIDRKR